MATTLPVTRAEERALALAGLLQACYLVTGIARSGLVGQDSMAGTLEAILVTDPDSALDVYPGGSGVRTGLRLTMEIFSDLKLSENGDTLRYASALLSLEKRLRDRPDLLSTLGAGIERIHEHQAVNSLGITDDEMVDRLARLYEDTAGQIEPRIRVLGQQKHLKNTVNTSRIRALLLAGLRSAVLWRQLGGSMTQFVLGRGKLLRSCDRAAQIIN